MAKKITGIDYAIKTMERLNISFEEKTENDGALSERSAGPVNVPRIRIVHVDDAWLLPGEEGHVCNDDESALLQGLQVRFLTDECRAINAKKCEEAKIQNSWRYYTPAHGTVCLAALQMSEEKFAPLNDEEKLLWNLTPDADVLLLPVREAVKITQDGMWEAIELLEKRDEGFGYLKFFSDTWVSIREKNHEMNLQDCIQHSIRILRETHEDNNPSANFKKIAIYLAQAERTFVEEQQLSETFEIIIKCAEAKTLACGDIVTVPMGASIPPLLQSDLPSLQLPIIHYERVERAIQTLTKKHNISVIIAAGNGSNCLDTPQNDTYLLSPDEMQKYNNRGVECGAVIVGAKPRKAKKFLKKINKMAQVDSRNARRKYPNYGKCVDVFGRYRASNGCLPEPTTFGNSYAHFTGASMATIVAAAGLYHVQQLKCAAGLRMENKSWHSLPPPPKVQMAGPFSARAKLRQWRVNSTTDYKCSDDLMGPPPNIEAWMKGCQIDSDIESLL